MKSIYDEALDFHRQNRGKLETKSKVPLDSREVLSKAYSPGVAQVSIEIARDASLAKEYTLKSNTIAVISDGSAILGLGNLGPYAAIPVMEGKAAIFKEFAGVDAFPICLETQDTEEIIQIVKNISPVFGGINLEDISAPRCFEIEERLRKELSIPVMHDDQWGAATVGLAGLINSLKLRNLDKAEVKVVINGIGAAGVATAKLLLAYGIKNITFCDSKGIIHLGRSDLNQQKRELLEQSMATPFEGHLSDAVVQANVFIGLSIANVVTPEMVLSMADKPIIFALANPNPEIMPELAKENGAFIVATGRSDYPNQLNNSLVFPGIFKGALEENVKQFDINLFIHIAQDLADYVSAPNPDMILPDMFDKGVVTIVVNAVKKWNSNLK